MTVRSQLNYNAHALFAWRGRYVVKRLGILMTLGALLGVFIGVAVVATPALAGGRGDGWQFEDMSPMPLDPSVCGFPGLVTPVANKAFAKELKTPDGSVLFLSTGTLKVAYTNLDTGKTITENVSGPAKTTVFPDNSVLVAARGNNAFILSAAESARFGIPRLAVTSGNYTFTLDPDGNITSLSLNGTVKVDICAALS